MQEIIMSRGEFKITIEDHDIDRRTNCPEWLDRFARDYAKKEQTAVDVARARNRKANVFEQMNAIINGKKALYSTVDEAVADYQKRTGLIDYLSKDSVSKQSTAAAKIIAAGEEADASPKEDERPALILAHPDIEGYINNVIDTNRHIQLPAIIQMIQEAFRRDGVSESDVDDSEFVRFVSQRLSERAVKRDFVTPANLGRGVGTTRDLHDMDDGNRDPFRLLVRPSTYI
jgi:hypothetical protein